MKKNLLISLVVVLVLAIAGGLGATYVVSQQAKPAIQTKAGIPLPVRTDSKREALPANTVTYFGVDGKTALELLQDKATVKMTGSGESAFVTSIDGVAADKTNYWSFSVNGAPATVGAGSYVTKADDSITWMLLKI